MTAGERWAESLASWAIPDEILRPAPESPFGFPVAVFERTAPADSPSTRRALAMLPGGGTVLDVGCGAGAAGLALESRAGLVVGVDESDAMLEAFERRASVATQSVSGRWPDVAGGVRRADVVVCHHVAYNVPDLAAFAAELDAHATRGVVVELTAAHPLSWMNPLWQELHGVERPSRPTFEDAVEVLREIGIEPEVDRWDAPFSLHDHIVEFVRRRLCLDASRDDDIRGAIERHPAPEVRGLVCLSWTAR